MIAHILQFLSPPMPPMPPPSSLPPRHHKVNKIHSKYSSTFSMSKSCTACCCLRTIHIISRARDVSIFSLLVFIFNKFAFRVASDNFAWMSNIIQGSNTTDRRDTFTAHRCQHHSSHKFTLCVYESLCMRCRTHTTSLSRCVHKTKVVFRQTYAVPHVRVYVVVHKEESKPKIFARTIDVAAKWRYPTSNTISSVAAVNYFTERYAVPFPCKHILRFVYATDEYVSKYVSVCVCVSETKTRYPALYSYSVIRVHTKLLTLEIIYPKSTSYRNNVVAFLPPKNGYLYRWEDVYTINYNNIENVFRSFVSFRSIRCYDEKQ